MRKRLALSLAALWPIGTLACPRCAPAVQAGVFNADFMVNALWLMAPLALIGLLAAALHRWGDRS